MTKKQFLDEIAAFFCDNGFLRAKDHFYKDLSGDVMLVFGFQQSSYGKYGYIEYGYCFKSINRHLPFPRFNQMNLNCGRLMTDRGSAIEYATIDEGFIQILEQTLSDKIHEMQALSQLNREAFIRHYLLKESGRSWYILGDETEAYFGLTRQDFKYHFTVSD